jgi:hypothetical protein
VLVIEISAFEILFAANDRFIEFAAGLGYNDKFSTIISSFTDEKSLQNLNWFSLINSSPVTANIISPAIFLIVTAVSMLFLLPNYLLAQNNNILLANINHIHSSTDFLHFYS